MSEMLLRAIQNAAASSAMEGLPAEQRHLEAVEQILSGRMTLEDYFQSLKEQE